MKTVGSRASVFRGHAERTSGGLRQEDLKLNKNGLIVSVKNSKRAKKKENIQVKAWREAVKTAYKNPKYAGKFQVIKKGSRFYNEVHGHYVKILKKNGYEIV